MMQGQTSVNARFTFTVVNQINEKDSVKEDADLHQFNANKSTNWGFDDFIPLRDLTHPHEGYIVNDTIIVEVDVFACKHEDNVDSQVDQDARYCVYRYIVILNLKIKETKALVL
ncbi:hypothetical protein ACFE04_001777 [Oxalis oulophora]